MADIARHSGDDGTDHAGSGGGDPLCLETAAGACKGRALSLIHISPEAYEPIDSSADAETIQQLQMRLYSLGLLSTDGLEPGVLDQMTLQAVADFQSQMNEQNGTALVVVDPTDPNAVIDVETLKLLFG